MAMAFRGTPQQAAEAAIRSIGLGYDVSMDIRFTSCKSGSRLIDLGNNATCQIVLPGGLSIANVPRSIKVDKGERVRYTSDVLSFQQMAEKFNQDLSLSGKIPSGLFNYMFEFSGAWKKDASSTKSLAFDGWFITLYTVALSQSQIVLCDHVKKAVPSSWDPLALSRFIKEFGTHVIISIKMGGKDVIYLRQQHSSSLQPAEFLNRLKEIADESFLNVNGQRGETCKKDNVEAREQRLRFIDFNSSSSYTSKEDIMKLPKRRGGIDKACSHSEWLQTVQSHPDVISMSFVPITSLLSGVPGSGFLSHAINLYLRYKPRLEELYQFLEFQLPRQWAPVFSDLPLGPQRKPQSSSSLPFNFIGPKLYVNTSMVDVDRKPVTGIRLYLEGKSGNRLAIHLQHLSSLPQILKLEKDTDDSFNLETINRRYYVPIQWKHLSHVCTAPVESDDEQSIVTGAQLQVAYMGFRKVLFLRLYFSKAHDMLCVRSDWDGSTRLTQKSGLISTMISTHFSSAMQKPPPPCPEDVNINSALYPGGPPMSVQAPRLLKLIDTTEMTRGPQDSPGYWMVSGAKLHVERGKISLRVKFSHLTAILPDDDKCIRSIKCGEL